MLHDATTAFCKRHLRKVAALTYDSSMKTFLLTTMIGQVLFLGVVPTVYTWAKYPCGGTLTGFYQADTGPYDPNDCYYSAFDIVTPIKGTTHTSWAFMFSNFVSEPYPRLVEVIIEPQSACFRCPEFTITCSEDYAFDQCWSQHAGSPDGSLATTLAPVVQSDTLDVLVQLHRYIQASGALDMCWVDDATTGACHPANISTSEISSAGPVQQWIPLELGEAAFNSTIANLTSSSPAAIRYSFWLTFQTSYMGNQGQPRPQPRVYLWEFHFDNWIRGLQDTMDGTLTLNFYTFSSGVTEMIWRVFPIVILALPFASIALSIVVQSSFARWSAAGKLRLVMPSSPMFTPSVLVIVAASLGVAAGVGLVCIIYPIFFFSQVLGSSLGLAVGVDDLLVVYSYLQGLILKQPTDAAVMREQFIDQWVEAALTTTLTTLTTMICFACSTYTVFPVQIEIGVACLICVFFCWVFSIFWFSPLMAMLIRRRQKAAAKGATDSTLPSKPTKAATADKKPPAPIDPMEKGSMAFAEPFFGHKLFKFLRMPGGAPAVIAVEIVLLVVGAWSLASMPQEAGFEPLLDKYESKFLKWQYATYRHFNDGYNHNITMLIQAPTVDYSSTTMQARIADAMAAVGASKFVDGASAESWLVHYLATCDGVTYACSGAGFYTGVDAWLTTAGGRRFAMDVSWADAAKTSIKASRMRFMETATNFARDAVEAYAVSQAVTQPYHDDLGLNLFNPKYMPFELDEIARTSWLLSLAMSAAGLVLALMLIFHPLIAITTTASIFAIQLMMMALFNLVGLRIGPMMIFNVSCAFGIASDSMVHVLHLWTCLRKRGAPPTGYDSHVQAVMAQLGTPIFFAGISTMGMFACFGPLAGAFAHIMMCHQLVLLFVIFVAVCLYHSVVFTPAVLLQVEKCFPLKAGGQPYGATSTAASVATSSCA